MSNPLDGRIRALARAEAEQVVKGVGVLDTTTLDTQGLQQQITDLHEHLHHAATAISRLEARIDVLEKADRQDGEKTEPTPRRASRRTTG